VIPLGLRSFWVLAPIQATWAAVAPHGHDVPMNPQIGAALIAVGGALIGAIAVIGAVYVTVRAGRKQKRRELAAAALSDYMKGAAELANASKLRATAKRSPDTDDAKQLIKDADQMEGHGLEVVTHAKTVLLAFADLEALHDLARWDRKPDTNDPHQQRALLKVLNGVRHQIDTKAGTVDESIGIGLMFGWPDGK